MNMKINRGVLVRKGNYYGLYSANNISSYSNYEVFTKKRLNKKHPSSRWVFSLT